ncbi:AraC family transcriptional regulator [Paenibacillus soyae]|uniref:AraC family transcriptional regulator n=1 Tax=Paenibacillus soyae TaxID=2969249 RepID=A0A9X2N1P3_9BACL|nr:helix-turn-helix domain-containing protein [Paenibacillus soyae]MCR2807387.1 AraC family transcriptional regulator [Paenibacillus soyae]
MTTKRDLAILLQLNDFSMDCKTDLKYPKQFHSHPGYELVWMMEGEAQYSFEDKVYQVTGGQLLVFKGSALHKVHVHPGHAYKRCVIHFTRHFFAFEQEVYEEFQRMLDRLESPHFLLALEDRDAGVFQGIIDRLYKENQSDDLWGKKGAIQIYLLELLLFVCREFRHKRPGTERSVQGPSDRVDMLEAVLRELNAVWNTAWSLEGLAGRLHMNKFYLCHFFKKEVGVTIQQYILQKRFHEAQKLLINTDMPVREVAAAVGFVSDSNFIRSFKKQMKTTPKHFRESAARQDYKL